MKFVQLLSLYTRSRREARALHKPVAKRPQLRASAFVLEFLETRVMLSATLMDLTQGVTSEPIVTAAVVTTDKPDYAPGETAVITTSNTTGAGLQFSAGELVRFQVTRTDGVTDAPSGPASVAPAGNAPWYVIDGVGGFTAHQQFEANGQAIDRDANGVADWIAPDNDLTVNGSISTAWFVEEQYLGASLQLTAVGQGAGAVATTAFTDAVSTTTAVTSSTATSTYGDAVMFTATVTAASGTVAPTGTVQFFDGATSLGSVNAATSTGTGTATWSLTTASLTAGTHASIHAVFIGTVGSFNDSTSGNLTQTVNKADATISVSGYSGVYDGAAHTAATGTALGLFSNSLPISIRQGSGVLQLTTTGIDNNSSAGLNGLNGYRYVNTVFPADQEAQVTLTGTPTAGSNHFVYVFLRTQNPNTASVNAYYIGYSATGNWSVGRTINAVSATRTVVPGTLLAAGDSIRASVVGNTITASSYHNGVWKAEVSFTMTGADLVSGSGYLGVQISGASPEVKLTNATGGAYTGVFGAPTGATGTATGVLGESLSGLVVSATPHTNAGTYSDPWTFTDGTGNYNNASGTVSSSIAKATATVTVSGYNGVFDGAAHGATGTAVGVVGENLNAGLSLGATFINIPGGTATWTFSGGTNYLDQSGSVAIVISSVPLTATTTTVTSSGTPSTYGNAVTFTATVTAAAGSAAPIGTVEFFDGATSLGIDSVANSTGSGTATWSLTTASLTAGTHAAIRAVYTATGSFASSASANLTQTVTQKALTGSFTAANKTYDGSTAATVLTRTLTGVLAGDLASVSLTGGTATFNTASAGTGKTVTLAGATLTGTAASNYTLTSVGTTTATIAALGLTGSFTAANKTYDGSTAATVLTRTLTGVLAGDLASVSLTGGTATFNTASAGTGKTVTLAGATLTGTAASNYTLTSVGTTTATIAALGLTGSFTAANKTYDGSTAATVLTRTLTGVLAGDLASVSLTGGTATFNTASAGTGKTVTLAGATLTGTAASNYTLTSVGTTTATIAALGLTGSFTAANKTYDGSTAATVLTRTLTGVLAGDLATVSLTGGTATFNTASAGTGKTVTLAGATLTGTAASNYTLTSVGTTTATIAALGLTGSFTAANKTYDGSTAATVLTRTLTGVLAGDLATVSLTGGTATFNTASAGTGKTVTLAGATLTGTAASNYTLTSVGTTTATIAALGLTGSFTAANKTYDGSTAATVLTRTLTGVLAGDLATVSLTGGTATFNTASAGTGKTVTLAGATLTGTAASNYTLTSVGTTTATIATLGITGSFTAADKPYDGGTAATVLTRTLTGVLAGDLATVSLTGGTATFATATVGTGKTVTLAGATLTGTAASNYTLTSVGTTTANIGKADATVTVTGYNGIFDGAAHGATGTAVGVVGENLSAGLNLGATFINIPGGTATWTFSGGTNYLDQSGSVAIVISNNVATTTMVASSGTPSTYGNAVTFTATVTATAGSAAPTGTVEFFDGTTSLGIDSVANSTGTGTATWSLTTASLTAGAHASLRAVYTATGSFASSASANLTQTVTQKALTGSFTAANKTYDGSTAATVLTRALTGVLASDLATVSLTGGSATFNTASAGTGKTVTLAGATLTGTAASNYTLTSVGTTTATIAKAIATITGGYSGVYDGAAHTATGMATGVLGEPLSGLVVSATPHTNAGTYSDPWTFTDVTGNYNNASGTVSSSIAKADATISVSGYSGVYDGAAHTAATGTALGLFSNSLPISIRQGSGVLQLTTTGIDNNSSAGLNGLNGYRYVNTVFPADQEAQVTLTGAPTAGSNHFVYVFLRTQNPNTASVNAYYIGYSATGNWSVGRTINAVSATRTVVPGTLLAAGDSIRASVVGNTITASSYHNGVWKAEVSFTMTGADLVSGSGYLGVQISGASPEVKLTNATGGAYTGVFGAPTGATGTATGVLGEPLSGLVVSATPHTNAGTYSDPWTFTDGTGNYNNASGTVSSSIAKATATVTVSGYNGVFDGAAHGATGTAVGVVGENLNAGLSLGATFINIPGGTATWTFSGGTNYLDQSGSVAIVISSVPLTATTTTVTSSGTPSTYGNAVTFTATVTAAAGSAAPIGTVEFFDGATSLGIDSVANSTGSGTATWSLTTASLTAGTHAAIRAVYTATGSFASSASANLTQTVTQKALTGSFTAANKTYDGSTAATVLTRTLTGVLAGDLASVSLTGGTATFNTASAGTGKTVTLAGATLTGTAASNYTLTSVGTTTANIGKADATVTVTGYNGIFDGAAHGATGTAVGVVGENLNAGLNLGATFINIPGGTATWTFSGGTNYLDQSGSVAIVISNNVATTTMVASSGTPSTYGNAVTFTATVTAAAGSAAPTGTVEFFDGTTSLGVDSVADSTGTGTATWSLTTAALTAGTHASLRAVYTATGNFTGSASANLTQTVTQKALTGSFTAADKTYDGSTAATVLTRALTGVLAGDVASVSLTGGTATFDTATVGTGKTVTLAGATLTGTAASNYTLTSVGTTTANIMEASAAPAIRVTNLANGDIVSSGEVVVEFSVANFILGDQGETHLNFYVDADTTPYQFFNGATQEVLYQGVHTHFVHWHDGSSIELHGLPVGDHTIRFALVDAADRELADPSAATVLNFSVAPAPDGTFILQPFVTQANFVTSMAFAPDGRLFYTEFLTGAIRVVNQAGQLQANPWYQLTVKTGGEEGLLGLAFDPNFATNGFVYVYYTAAGPERNRIVRLQEVQGVGSNMTVILDNLPAYQYHNGGKLKFGPDGKLYVVVGDTGQYLRAQDLTFLGGKILRLNKDGSIPVDNPFPNSLIYSYGHRNSFGITFDPHSGELWETENGVDINDEVNRIVAGGNYGWQVVNGVANDPRFIDPIVAFTPVIAPTGIAVVSDRSIYPAEYYNNLIIADYNFGAVRRVVLNGANLNQVESVTVMYSGGQGVITDLVEGPDGRLYASFSDKISTLALGSSNAGVISNVAAAAQADGTVLVTWNTNFLSDAQVEYGPTAAYGRLTPIVAGSATSHAVIVSGLDPSTTYHYRVRSRNGAGVILASADATFTTAGPAATTWTARESNRDWVSVASSADGTKLVAAEQFGQLYTSTDAGATWTAQESNRDWVSVASSADGTKLVAAAYGGQLYTSTDAGATWTARESNRAWFGVASSADGTKLVAGDLGGQLYTSTDAGATWTAQESNRAWFGVASSADGTKLVAAAYGGQLYTSTDAGATWTAQESNRDWVSVASSADGTKLVAAEQFGQLYTSTDAGATWTAQESNRDWVSVASSADGTKLVAAEQFGQLYTSTDAGATWTAQESNRDWVSVASSADGTKLVAGDLGGQLYTSTA